MEFNKKKDQPLVSCLMVTYNRPHLVKRAVHCFLNQTWQNKELVIVDDGEEDLSEILSVIEKDRLVYHRIPKEDSNTLGKLRNITLELARGDYLVQWDDDDWYHPQRIEVQVKALLAGYDACCLSGTLMHLNTLDYFNLPYVGYLKNGIPGSIMHVKDEKLRYQELKKAEDTYYLNLWMKKKYLILGKEHTDKFIRCFHGKNTWDVAHFKSRIRNTIPDAILYSLLAVINKIPCHPRFNLKKHEKEAFKLFLKDTIKFDLLDK